MALTVDRSNLKKVVATLARVADRKSTMPALGYVSINVDRDSAALVATDLNVWARFDLTVADKTLLGRTPGSVAVKAKGLADLLGKLPDGEITIARKDHHAIIMRGTASLALETLGGRFDDLPHCKFPTDAGLLYQRIDAGELTSAIKRVSHAVCKDETRFHLNGIHIEATGKSVRMVSTDGHRLALVNVSIQDWILPPNGIILPAKGASELVKTLTKGHCQIASHGPYLFVKQDGWSFALKCIDAQFPPYAQVIPAKSEHAVCLDMGSLVGATERAMTVATDTRGMKLARSWGKPELQVSADNPDTGETTETIPATLGEPFKVGINPKYLLEAIKHIESRTSNVEIMVGSESSNGCVLDPIVIHSTDDTFRHVDTKYLVVVMPMRI
jgi:DNA polymerase III subunit beta